jgi:hypothetical protein
MTYDGLNHLLQAEDSLAAGTRSSVDAIDFDTNYEIPSGGIDNTRILNLSADKITAGTISSSIVYAGSISANQLSAGTINGTQIMVTNLDAGNITTGTLSLSGNGVNLNATSGTLSLGTGVAIKLQGALSGGAKMEYVNSNNSGTVETTMFSDEFSTDPSGGTAFLADSFYRVGGVRPWKTVGFNATGAFIASVGSVGVWIYSNKVDFEYGGAVIMRLHSSGNLDILGTLRQGGIT